MRIYIIAAAAVFTNLACSSASAQDLTCEQVQRFVYNTGPDVGPDAGAAAMMEARGNYSCKNLWSGQAFSHTYCTVPGPSVLGDSLTTPLANQSRAYWKSKLEGCGLPVPKMTLASAGRSTPLLPSRFGFGWCYMQNDRVPERDMPVYTSAIFPRRSNTQLYENNLHTKWSVFIHNQPGFQGGTHGGCGRAPTEAAARAGLESDVGVPLRSYSWAYRKDTDWTPN